MDSKMFLDAIAKLPTNPVKVNEAKFHHKKYEPTGRPATVGMLLLLALKMRRKGVKVSALSEGSIL